MDPWSAVADEVALEGLDGITIPTLWIRLEDRLPRFPLKFDDCTKELIWRSLISNTDLKFYELPEERGDVVLTDRFKENDPEAGTETAQKFPEKKKDVYPVHIILENKDGIQGSCAFFIDRIDITKHVRSKSLTALVKLEEALERYGRKLVVVASQSLRFRTLIGSESDPDLKLNDDSYCVLERVGRARWQGELQSDLHGSSFKTDARKLHYMRKSLVKHGLISMQSHVTRVKSGQQQHSILLLLKRFHINRRSKYDILMEYVSNVLQQLPGQFATLITFKEQLNMSDSTFKRVCQYMRTSKLVEFCQYPLEDLDPSAGPCTTKKGNKVLVRCLRLLKPYSRKGVTDDDDDDEDEEDDSGARRGAFPQEPRIMEKDVLSQAYHIVLSSGTKGIPKTGIGYKMNVGKLESRMLCRRLEREGLIKGFMEDEGRQRTTKYISHKSVGVSDQLQLFAKEQERKKLLYSSAPRASHAAPATPETPSSSKSTASKKIRKAGGEGDKGAMEGGQTCSDEGLDGGRGKVRGKSGARGKTTGRKGSETQTDQVQPTPGKCETSACSESNTSVAPDVLNTEQAATEEGEQSNLTPASSLPQSAASPSHPADNNIVVVKDVCEGQSPSPKKPRKSLERSHETYRLLKRKNLIVEAVRNFKIIEGLFPLQKMINDEEKQDGVSSKCCKKTILRLVHGLSREGLLKIYTTTVIQDGITKKVEMVVHPSIQPSDDIVHRVIEQVRFKISSSYSAVRLQHAEEKLREQESESEEASTGSNSKADKRRAILKNEEFKPTTVRGLGKTFGFQPKMHRLRVVHNFLWYLMYGHPLRHNSTSSDSTGETPANLCSSDPEAKHQDKHEKQDLKDTQNSTNTDRQTQLPKKAAAGSEKPQIADSAVSKLDETSGDEEEEQTDESPPGRSQSDLKVYTDEESWKKFIPPVRAHKEFSGGWAMVGDLLLCLPLSIFIQVIQINYKVDGLEEYLNDPVKQHHLVRSLPARMRRQLLYKRKYLFSFHENLQKLVYMGLLQFGPLEKFKEKDQVFVYLKRHATIVDTTNAEPHYWLVTELSDKPFERRQYTFNTHEDVENYWFDLMCVCLNTPLGVIRSKRNVTDDDSAPSFVQDRNVFVGMANLLKGSREVCDDGSIPGDGKGAGGLDSEFFAHLKRNWLWTNHLLSVKPSSTGLEAKENKIRLKSLLSKNALRIALKAGGMTTPRYVTTKRPLLLENVEVDIEPASRNQRVVGGKRQKRKRSKKEVVKVPRKKKKEPKKRTPAHDEADHRALKMMTRQRVYWSVQEDSLMMLCSVASHLLNSKLKRPFIPHCGVRDLLHAEFEMSMDKTSVAVGRRSRYILKNPQTLLNYRICLAEVYQDKSLMKLLEEKKPGDPDKPEDCAEAFSEYARLLRQKFSTVMSTRDMTMPDTKQQLFSRFKVSTIDNGKWVSSKDALNSTDDIHAIVLHNLIQSTLAMTNCQMKSSRSFQTFHMYSRYNQELLCQVFIQCRKRGLVNRRRVNQPFGPKKNRALPILPMSYQLSQSYYRCFSWRFPHSLCTDSFRFLRNIINNGTRDDRPLTVFHHETENRSENSNGGLERKTGSKRKEKQSGGKAEGRPESQPEVQPNTESTKEGENDQRQVKGDEKLMDVDMNNEVMNKTDEQLNPGDCLTASSAEDPSSREQTDDHLPKEEPSGEAAASNTAPKVPEDPPDVSDMLQFSLDSSGGACVISLSLMSLGLLSVYVSIPKQMVVVDSNLVDNDVVKSMAALEEEDDDDYDGEECEGRKKLEVKAHQASHTNYLMMRGYCCPGIVKLRNLNTNDNIVVESCIMKLQLRSTPAHNMFTMENCPPLDLTKCGPSLLPPILTYTVCSPSSSSSHSVEECDRLLIQQRGYTPQDIEAWAQLRRSLYEAGQNGLDVHDLYQAHTHLEEPRSGRTRSLQQYMKELQEEGQVVKAGGLGVRWVLTQHAEPWLLTVNTKQWSQSRFTSDKLPFLENEHHIPFMRKRSRLEGQHAAEEPPAKKPAVDRQESEDKEEVEGGSSDLTREKLNEEAQLEKQKESADVGSGDKQLDSKEEEGGKQTHHEVEAKEDAGREKMETEEGQEEEREQRVRKDRIHAERDEDACSPLNVDENVSFISRPWRMVDGTLNRQVCKGMLEATLYHIMSRPGLTLQTLVEHYKDVLQPMAVLDLMQALIDMGCVTKKTLVKGPKPSLFTRSVHQTRKETDVKIEEPDTVFYEPTISCCLRLSQVLPNERHWNYCIP
ncbi:general transcription factor 3C polypeptide 1 isoform X3 [Seriola lalandi dorsalis]|uniref:general transcription factor 3C polypeptide 1 isoform X1 n=1 Tax=Seriola lalandi dorsalis TaxID=1841481 RepID=UPI000C6F595A|nr:general transcription factor 3C polypeptide 1 isoform X1 [Seriola lalandi dorsalis]XP_023257020.1 general transcription factor 3C polypeptide 1 isoform X3 [Seriola lalandi dorsalis]